MLRKLEGQKVSSYQNLSIQIQSPGNVTVRKFPRTFL